MQALQNCDSLSSDTHAMDQLQDFLPSASRNARVCGESRRFIAAEREALDQERRLCIFVSIALEYLLEYPPRG